MNELIILLVAPIILAPIVYLLDKYLGGSVQFLKAKVTTTVIILLTTLFTFYLWVTNFTGLDWTANNGFVLQYTTPWIESVGITFSVGVDGLSMPLLVLTQVVFLVSVWSSFFIHDQEATYYALILVLLSGVTGTFVSLDLFLFYIAWELVLVPMFFIIQIWGGPNRKYAAMKFFIFTHLASLLMLIGLFLLYLNGGQTFYMPELKANLGTAGLSAATLSTMFWLVFIGFVTKFPQVPVHTWLPDAHVQAPSPGSAILAGLLLKMGGYGLIRIPFWLYSDVKIDGTPFFLTEEGKTIRVIIGIIGMVSMVWPAFVALKQTDLKRMIAYSSISHMGIVLLGLAAYNQLGLNGAMYMMIAHGVISPGLFLLSGIVEHNTKSHTRDMRVVGGLGAKMPFTTAMFVFLGFASAGLPGLAGFVAEFTVFVGLFQDKDLMGGPWVWIPIIAVLSIIVTAGYYLWAIQRVLYGDPTEELENTHPGKMYENGPIVILSFFALFLGLLPFVVWTVLTDFSASIL